MSILAWIEEQKRLKLLNAPKYVNPASDSSKGLWTRCDKCGVILYIKHLKENQRVCFGCSYHLQMSSQERVENLLDKESWRPLDETVSPCDPLGFHDQKDYTDRLQEAQERTGLQDAIQTGSGMVDGIPVALGVMDFDFMGGSMGSVVGEKVTRLIEYATQEGLTLILVCASGGARMQEGVFSLMQMAKISSALQVYQSCANLLYISILTSPTTGGVTASFAMLGDIILAEPKALIAFAGRRVIEQTLCEDLPDDFQTSEYMLHHGLLDLIVPRRFLRQALSETIRLYKDAPFKKPGRIPYGVQNPISFLMEEKLRRHMFSQAAHNPQRQNAEQQATEALHVPSFEDSSFEDSSQIRSTTVTLQPSEKFKQKSLLQLSQETSLNQNQTHTNFFKQNVLSRNTGNYRNILTSFQTMFYLFSKQRILPFAYDTNRARSKATLGDASFATRSAPTPTIADAQKINQLDTTGVDVDTTWFSHNAQQDNTSLYGFFGLSEEINMNDTLSLSQQKNGTSSNGTTPKSDQKNIDFFNKSIDFAATESVEWRAFYVHQRISKTTGFLEDFVKIEPQSTETVNTTFNKIQDNHGEGRKAQLGFTTPSIEQHFAEKEKPQMAELTLSESQIEILHHQKKLSINLNVQNTLFYKSILR